MELIRPFERLGKGDAGIAGGKGASLGEMAQAGISVPPGFVLLANAFERFLDEADLRQELDAILHTVNKEEMHIVEHASEKIQTLITDADMPADIAQQISEQFAKLGAEFVAVRSSATAEDSSSAAWAGQLDTFLNTTEENLLRNVQRCWASLFTPRAIFYRFEKGMHDTKISVAVVVQKMVQSEVSGIAFSVHPVTEDYNQMIIEAGFGLGEAIVSGQVTPDSYVIEKSPRRIIDKNVTYQNKALWRAKDGGNEWRDLSETEGSKPALSDEQALELSEIVMQIEKHYGFPCDIEWAFEAGKFFITQSRPITTLAAKKTETVENVPEELRLEYVKMGRWALLPADQETWHTKETAKFFKDRFGVEKESLATFEFGGDFFSTMFIPKRFVDTLHARIAALTGQGTQALEKELQAFYEEREHARREVRAVSVPDYRSISTAQLIDLYRRNRTWAHRIVIFDQFGWIAEEYWTPILEKALTNDMGLKKGSAEYNDTLFKLIKPREISTTLEEKKAVIEKTIRVKARKESIETAAETLSKQFGWMPVFAYGTPWNSDHYVDELKSATQRDQKEMETELESLTNYTALRDADFRQVVSKYVIEPEIVQPFIDFGLVIDTRNEAEYVVSLCGYFLLPIYNEIAARLAISIEEVRTLFEEEIVACLDGKADAKTLIAEKAGYSANACFAGTQRLNLSGDVARAAMAYAESHSRVIGSDHSADGTKGVSASPGKARGVARIIPNPSENDRVGEGDILITFATTVDYLPAMKKAGAIVTEVGGLTCHAAVVSREFGIPCVVGLKDAMTTFKDGDMVEVDADKGVVRKV